MYRAPAIAGTAARVLAATIAAGALGMAGAGGAEAAEVRVGIPLGSTIEAAGELAWRDAEGRRGSGHEVATAGLSYPVRLRGDGTATSGGARFPLPANLVAFEGEGYALLELDLERYLGGVVPVEMHPDWPTAALEAQAILARTFAWDRIRSRRAAGASLDLVAGTRDQAYRWTPAVADGIAAVVDATDEQVMLRDDGSLAAAFYHSCSGGRTADPREVWGRAVPGLTSVEDPHSQACPHYFWRHRMVPAELGGLLGLGPVAEIRITARGPSERVMTMVLTDDASTVELTGTEFRRRVGAGRIRSTLFRVRVDQGPEGPHWSIDGSGSGHGLGLSQFGAKAMAEAGHSAAEILAFYFPRYHLGEVDE